MIHVFYLYDNDTKSNLLYSINEFNYRYIYQTIELRALFDKIKIDVDEINEVSSMTEIEKPSTELVCEYRGISAKSLKYEFPIDDRVDVKGITVKADDGILTIILPVNKKTDEDELTIPVN